MSTNGRNEIYIRFTELELETHTKPRTAFETYLEIDTYLHNMYTYYIVKPSENEALQQKQLFQFLLVASYTIKLSSLISPGLCNSTKLT